MKLIDGNKEKDANENRAIFTSGLGLYEQERKDFDVFINGVLVLWFRADGTIEYNEYDLEKQGFKSPKNVND